MRNFTTPIFGLSLLIFLLHSVGCVPPSNEKMTEVRVNMRDKQQQRLYDFQDQGNMDSLYSFLSHEDPTFRYLAVNALASIRDTSAINKLAPLLADDVEKVRTAAAYAIGQTGGGRSEDYLLRAFAAQDTTKKYHSSNAAILEAIGKVGKRPYLKALATISTYLPTDTLLLEGQCYGIYRYALRDMVDTVATNRMIAFVNDMDYPSSVQFIAANYLARAKNINLAGKALQLDQALSKAKEAKTKMALVLALGKTKEEAAKEALINVFNLEKDYRVKANIIRALGNFDYLSVQPTVFAALDDPNIHIANTAADFFIGHGDPNEANLYRRKAKDPNLNWETQVKLYSASNIHTPRFFGKSLEAINYELRQKYTQSTNPYEQAAIVRALGSYGYNYWFLVETPYLSSEAVVRTASMEAFNEILNMDNFSQYFGANYFYRMKELTGYIIEAIRNGDPGMIAIGAGTLRSEKLDFSAVIDSTAMAVMEKSLQTLDLPKEIETYNELLHTIQFFKKEDFIPKKPDYNEPIEWVVFNNLPKENKATLKTNKGDIVFQLMKDEAPGSVTNFAKLVKRGFYANKKFHRVVPNFVIQGGCPRGDGYGALDYTIRTEVPDLHYDEAGYVGMASAGANTEGTQFFITHSPTLHLDGRYTIFAKVIEGMDVVHKISTADVIKEVVLE